MEGSRVRHDHGLEVSIDRAVCVGSGPCFVLAPAAFTLDENMKAVVLNPSLESEQTLLQAAEECPTQAIYLARHGDPIFP
jgi:ferredoxin